MNVAGGIMEVWLTAFQLLHKVGSIKENDTVFVHAAASGGYLISDKKFAKTNFF